MIKTILSLCDRTGFWPSPYETAGYNVIRVDLSSGDDVRLLRHLSVPIWGVLASPPCTVLTCSRTRPPVGNDDLLQAMSVVDACLRAVVLYRPNWWALENPRGRLSRFLGPPRLEFQPSWYGDNHMKRTCLWGSFTLPSVLFAGSACLKVQRDWVLRMPGSGKGRSDARSETPLSFAQAFFAANP